MAHGDIVTYKYWNAGGVPVAIVAIEGGANDVGAYIGGDPNPRASEEDTVQRVAHFGAKLTYKQAMAFLPALIDSTLRYRD